jgi:nucleoporin GLE1
VFLFSLPQCLLTVFHKAALDVLGSDARDIWGYQWVKLLALVYEGVTASLDGGNFIGSEAPEGKAARVRVQLEIERIMTVRS